MPSSNAVTEPALGAWVIKCNPEKWDFGRFIDEGGKVIREWSVVENYRSAMMRHGQRVLLWVTGPVDGNLPRGFWGSGWITGPFQPAYAPDEPLDENTPEIENADLWLDEEAASRVEFFAPMHLTVWNEPVVEAAVTAAAPELDQLEVIRMRQGSNPSWISVDDLALLEPLLPAWPDPAPEDGQVITVGRNNVGEGDAPTRAVVEAAAIRATRAHYEAAGYCVESVERAKCGWDLTCTSPAGEIARVEVKGASGPNPSSS